MFVTPTLRRAVFVALTATALTVPVLPSASAAGPIARYLDCSAASNGDGSQASPWNTLATA
ncbi:right-handed parallel beta-helix repeat-containing protein, partial [Kitasatospora sp. NPDC004240]